MKSSRMASTSSFFSGSPRCGLSLVGTGVGSGSRGRGRLPGVFSGGLRGGLGLGWLRLGVFEHGTVHVHVSNERQERADLIATGVRHAGTPAGAGHDLESPSLLVLLMVSPLVWRRVVTKLSSRNSWSQRSFLSRRGDGGEDAAEVGKTPILGFRIFFDYADVLMELDESSW